MARPGRRQLRRPLPRGVLAAAILSIAFDAAAIDSSLLRAEHLLRKGVEALRRGELDRAEGAFLRARAAAPELPHAEILLGHVEMARGNFAEAESAYLEGIARYQQITGRLRVETQRRAQQLRDRIDEISIQVDSASGAASAGSYYGAETRGLQLRAKAISLQRRADDLNATLTQGRVPPEVFVYLGTARLRGGRAALAADAYRRAVDLAPAAPAVHYRLALALAMSGRLDEAEAACESAEALGYESAAELCARIEGLRDGTADADRPAEVLLVP